MKKLLISLGLLSLTAWMQTFASTDLQLKDLWLTTEKIYTKLCNIGDSMSGSNQIDMTFSKVVNPIISKTYVPALSLIKSQCVDAFMDKADIWATEKDTVRVSISWAKWETNFSNNILTRYSNWSLEYWNSSSTASSASTASSNSSSSSVSSSSISSNGLPDIYVKEFFVTPSQKNIKISICTTWLSNINVETFIKNVQTGKYVVSSNLASGCYDINKSFWDFGIDYKSWANYDIQVFANYKKDIVEANYFNNVSNLNIVYNDWTWKWIDPNTVSIPNISSSSSTSSTSSSSLSSSSSKIKINFDGFPTMKKYCRVYNDKIRVCLPYQAAKIKVDRTYLQYEKLLTNLTNEEKISKINETIVQLKTKYPSLTKPSEKLSVEYMLFKLIWARWDIDPTTQYTFDINSILN